MDFERAPVKKPRPFTITNLNPEPPEWQVFDDFDFTHYTVCEIGCGTGLWSFTQAQQNPDKVFIGIERTQNRFKQFANQAKTLNLNNLVAIRADATRLLAQKFPENSIDELLFFYPNPTPKKRQANQRYFVSPSFAVYNRCLKPQGKITLTSNVWDYIDEAKRFLEGFWDYQTAYFSSLPPKQEPRTAFEKKYLEQGQGLFEAGFVKNAKNHKTLF